MADIVLFACVSTSLIVSALVGGRAAYLIGGLVALGALALVLLSTPVEELNGWGLLAGLLVGGAVGAFLSSRHDD